MIRRGHFICRPAADYGGGLVSLIYLIVRSCQSRPLLWLDPPTLIKKKKKNNKLAGGGELIFALIGRSETIVALLI